MDSSMMKAMLESQERAYKNAMDVVVRQMNERITQLEGKVSSLTASLEYTQKEVDDLKSLTKEQEEEKKGAKLKINTLIEEVKEKDDKIKELEERINYQDDYSRRKNVRISGVPEPDSNETWEQTAASVTSMLQDKMQLPGLVLERAHRVGLRRDAKPRTIVARFSSYCDRESVMRNARKLKGTNIFVNDDLCPASQVVKNAQMPLLKQARQQGKIAFFRHTKLIIKERYNNDDYNTGRRGGQRWASAGAATAGATAATMSDAVDSSPLLGGSGGVGAQGASDDVLSGGLDEAPAPTLTDNSNRHTFSLPATRPKKNLRSNAKK